MPLNFTPKTEEELKGPLFQKGEYDFDIIGAEDTASKAGNQMIKLLLKVYHSDGSVTQVFDYLLETLEYKIKHFCDTTGLAIEYQSGVLDADMCLNRSGKCKLDIQKDKSGQYEDKNVVKDYIGIGVDAATIAGIDDSVPF